MNNAGWLAPKPYLFPGSENIQIEFKSPIPVFLGTIQCFHLNVCIYVFYLIYFYSLTIITLFQIGRKRKKTENKLFLI